MKPIFGVHNIVDAVSGEQVKALTGSGPTVELPAGIYNVAFGGRMWKSVEVPPFRSAASAENAGGSITQIAAALSPR
jgi:hypothetical protein